jgi:hypothetical protein
LPTTCPRASSALTVTVTVPPAVSAAAEVLTFNFATGATSKGLDGRGIAPQNPVC